MIAIFGAVLLVLSQLQEETFMAKAAAGKKTKLEVVREIIEQGVTKAAEIVEVAKAQGVEITVATASNYKHQLGKSKPNKRGGRKPGRPAKKVATPIIRDTATGTVSTGLELENLALRLIIKAGSADKARGLIDKLS